MLCELCRAINLRPGFYDERGLNELRSYAPWDRPPNDRGYLSRLGFSYAHAKNASALRHSAEKGCQLCRMLVSSISSFRLHGNIYLGEEEAQSLPTSEVRLTLVPFDYCGTTSSSIGTEGLDEISQYLLLATCGSWNGVLEQMSEKGLLQSSTRLIMPLLIQLPS